MRSYKDAQENFGGNGYFGFLDCGSHGSDMYFKTLSNYTLQMCVVFCKSAAFQQNC